MNPLLFVFLLSAVSLVFQISENISPRNFLPAQVFSMQKNGVVHSNTSISWDFLDNENVPKLPRVRKDEVANSDFFDQKELEKEESAAHPISKKINILSLSRPQNRP